MPDDEIKQLLRELVALQRETLEQIKLGAEIYEKSSKQYAESDAIYRTQFDTSLWEKLVRVITMLGVVILLGYVIFR